MTGEMSRADVTREAFPLHFAIADRLSGSVHPFDVYQGPYVCAAGHRLWLIAHDEGGIAVYSQTAHRQSDWFWDEGGEFTADIAEDLIAGGGFNPDRAAEYEDAERLCRIGEG